MAKADPTANALREVKAAVRRLDDLAESRQALADERHRAVRREMKLRAKYEGRMTKAEAGRLDALRTLDRAAVDTLAKSAILMADTLRKGQEEAARALATQTETFRKDLEGRVNRLENLQAAGSGKGAGLDKAWVTLGGLVALLTGLWVLGEKFFGH